MIERLNDKLIVVDEKTDKPIILNSKEKALAGYNEKYLNALGYDVDVTILTAITKKVVREKFFTVAPADYLPIKIGEGAWSQQLVTFRSFDVADDFESGIINTSSDDSRLAITSTAFDTVSIQIRNWAKGSNWTLPELQQATKAGDWSLIQEKQRSRKRNWDLGIQKVAFLGLTGLSKGLLELSGIVNNTTRIPKLISTMTPDELKTLIAGLVADYRANANHTAFPSHFIIPEIDFLGMAGQASAVYPGKDVLDLVLESFRKVTNNPNFKVLPLAYANKGNNTIGQATGTNRYVLHSYDEDSLRMDIPVDYTATAPNTHNGFQFGNVGYGQFTGVLPYRPSEVLYFSNTV